MVLGFTIGYVIGGILALVVTLLVLTILTLAWQIGTEAPKINAHLEAAVEHTGPLAALRDTIEHATVIIAGLARGRERLGG
ncbi:MAG: hypothetical protein J2P26_04105 [Nocardiopsaceae bacterium]|nr:hypothetical protein [Nocardiopsaceae bacterium]